MKDSLRHKFKTYFGKEADLVFFSPGRINLIGEHIDYNDGFVFPAAIDKGIYIAISKSPNSNTCIHAMDTDETFISSKEENPAWAKYIQAINNALREKEISPIPFQAVFSSDLPIGAGLSSSAALCTGFLFALNVLKPWKLDKISLAKLAQRAEHLVGINCGLLDQFAILFARENQFMKLDCLSYEKEYYDFNRKDLKLMIINSNVSHELASTAYNQRRKTCKMGFNILQKEQPELLSFRNLEEKMINESKGLKKEEKDCLIYVVQELRRVKKMTTNLNTGNSKMLGSILNEAHEGLKSLYRVTCEETDFLVDRINELKQVYGARQMGGGFGGSIICFVDASFESNLLDGVFEEFSHKYNKQSEAIFPSLSNGIHAI